LNINNKKREEKRREEKRRELPTPNSPTPQPEHVSNLLLGWADRDHLLRPRDLRYRRKRLQESGRNQWSLHLGKSHYRGGDIELVSLRPVTDHWIGVSQYSHDLVEHRPSQE